MFYRPPCPFGRGGFLFGILPGRRKSTVENAGHHIESALARAPGFERIRREPRMGPAAQAALFSFVDRLGGETMSCRLNSNSDSIPVSAQCRSYRPSTLDLHEDEHRPVSHDQIDLDAVGTDVARDDAIPSCLEKTGSLGFAFVSESLSRITHGWAFGKFLNDDGLR